MAKSNHSAGPEKEPIGKKIEAAKTPELSSLLKSLSKLRSAIQGDEPIDVAEVEKIERQAGKLSIQTGDKSITLKEAKKSPNPQIWAEILAGNFKRMEELTELPAFVISKAPDIPQDRGHILFDKGEWRCPRLVTFGLDAAKALAERKNTIVLPLSTDISYETAHFLAESGVLVRRNTQADREALRLTPAWTHAMFHKLENSTGSLSDTETNDIDFILVKEISPEVVKEMEWKVTGHDKRMGYDTGIGWEGVTLEALESLDLPTAKAMVDNPLLPTVYLSVDTRFESPDVAKTLLKKKNVKTMVYHYVEGGHMKEEDRERYDEVKFNAEEIPGWQLAYHLRKTPKMGKMEFLNLTSIDEKFVDALAKYRGKIEFTALASIDLPVLQKLCSIPMKELRLTNISSLNEAQAKAMAQFPGELSLPGITTLDVPSAKILSGGQAKKLTFFRLEKLHPEVAKVLAALSWRRLDVGYGAAYKQIDKLRKDAGTDDA